MTIEILQLVLMRGLFEWDDMISNTIGAFAGNILYTRFIRRVHNMAIVRIVISVVIIGCIAVIIEELFLSDAKVDMTPRMLCCQVDEVEYDEETVKITGFAFRYEQEIDEYTIILRSTKTAKSVKMKTERNERQDVNEYFFCDYDYSESGFIASGMINAEEEYEVMVKWPHTITLSTGIYITGTKIHYISENIMFEPPTGGEDLNEIIEKGILKVYRPDYHCWVYQIGSALYWIVDKDFVFEDNGFTYIQYHLWTTQEERLPKNRTENGWMWENNSGPFEKYELNGDFGPYRVSCRNLPKEYSITAILTGYYKKGRWIWGNYFRPDYKFIF